MVQLIFQTCCFFQTCAQCRRRGRKYLCACSCASPLCQTMEPMSSSHRSGLPSPSFLLLLLPPWQSRPLPRRKLPQNSNHFTSLYPSNPSVLHRLSFSTPTPFIRPAGPARAPPKKRPHFAHSFFPFFHLCPTHSSFLTPCVPSKPSAKSIVNPWTRGLLPRPLQTKATECFPNLHCSPVSTRTRTRICQGVPKTTWTQFFKWNCVLALYEKKKLTLFGSSSLRKTEY